MSHLNPSKKCPKCISAGVPQLIILASNFSFCHSAQGKQQNKQYGWYCISGFWNKEGTRDSEDPRLVIYLKEYYNVIFETKQGSNLAEPVLWHQIFVQKVQAD